MQQAIYLFIELKVYIDKKAFLDQKKILLGNDDSRLALDSNHIEIENFSSLLTLITLKLKRKWTIVRSILIAISTLFSKKMNQDILSFKVIWAFSLSAKRITLKKSSIFDHFKNLLNDFPANTLEMQKSRFKNGFKKVNLIMHFFHKSGTNLLLFPRFSPLL